MSPEQRQQRTAIVEAQLAAVHEDTGWWLAVHTILDDLESGEIAAVCDPGVGGDASHFNRGRLAMLRDLRTALQSKRRQLQADPAAG